MQQSYVGLTHPTWVNWVNADVSKCSAVIVIEASYKLVRVFPDIALEESFSIGKGALH